MEEFRNRALSPNHPVARGTAQNPDVYFQGREAQNPFYQRIPEIVEDTMNRLAGITGRSYKLFDYYGDEDAENVIRAMGPYADTIKERSTALKSRARSRAGTGEALQAFSARIF